MEHLIGCVSECANVNVMNTGQTNECNETMQTRTLSPLSKTVNNKLLESMI